MLETSDDYQIPPKVDVFCALVMLNENLKILEAIKPHKTSTRLNKQVISPQSAVRRVGLIELELVDRSAERVYRRRPDAGAVAPNPVPRGAAGMVRRRDREARDGDAAQA